MSAPEWDDNLQAQYDYITHGQWDLDFDDVDVLEANGFTLEEFEAMFAEAFMQHGNSPDNEILPSQRYSDRQTIYQLIDAMGYDISAFDWQRWREQMGYG